MATTISSMIRRCHTLTTEIVALLNELKGLCNLEDYRNISATVHQLNADIYDSLVALKLSCFLSTDEEAPTSKRMEFTTPFRATMNIY